MRSCLITHSLALALCVSVLTNADTVTLNGAQYTNVYVSPGTALYYIRFADDGTQISVPKSVLSERDIRISRDATARTKIMDAWKLKRDEFPIHERKTLTYTEWKERFKEPSTAVPPPIVSPAPDRIRALTNSHDRLARSTTKGKVFMDSEGTRIMTNAPGRFENNKEYVEIQLDFEQIDIPQRFKGGSTPTPNTTHTSPESFDEIIAYYADYYSLDKALVYAVIKQESNGNPYAVSSAGARGLMQLMPGTASDMGVRDIFDPAQNVAGGTQYLSKMKKLFNGNITLALAGYNAGPGNVRKYGNKVPPFAETQDYVRRVQQYQRQYLRYGAPTFAIAELKPVKNDYLPPTTEIFYQIILENGLTVRADNVLDDDDAYVYVFKGRSGRIRKDKVKTIYDPE